MIRRPLLGFALLLGTGLCPLPADPPAGSGAGATAEPPAQSYAIPGKPSEVAQDLAAMVTLAGQVARDAEAELSATGAPRDKAALIGIHTNLYAAAMLRKDFAAAGKHLERVRGLQEEGAGKHLTGLFTGPLIQAHDAPGADIHATYRRLLSQRLAALPFAEVAIVLDRLRTAQRAASKAQLVGGLAVALDPQVKEGRVTREQAALLLSAAVNLHLTLPMREDVVACLDRLFETHQTDGAARTGVRTPLRTTRIQARGPYFGQALPGETPVRFAPAILESLSPWVSGIAFSPDGSECFLHVGAADYGRADMYSTRCVDGAWTPLVEPAFLAGFTHSHEPVYSPDGNTLTFTGRREGSTTDFWTVARTAVGWAAPVPMPAPINTEANEFRGSFAADGAFYFGSERASPGINQVFKATKNAAREWVVEELGAPINARSYDGDPCIAPDGRFLVTYAARAGGQGRVDLYVSFSDGKGGWGKLINLGPAFNSPDDEFGACLSADGNYLFFNRHTAKGDQLFWVAVSAIDKLRP